MKIRTDFVTNSSSASYILTFKSTHDKEDMIDSFIYRAQQEYVWKNLDCNAPEEVVEQAKAKWKKEYESDLRALLEAGLQPTETDNLQKLVDLSKNKKRLFTLTYETSMHNNYVEDMPNWYKEFLLELLADDKLGFEYIKYKTKHTG